MVLQALSYALVDQLRSIDKQRNSAAAHGQVSRGGGWPDQIAGLRLYSRPEGLISAEQLRSRPPTIDM